jgi:hypothetical protein
MDFLISDEDLNFRTWLAEGRTPFSNIFHNIGMLCNLKQISLIQLGAAARTAADSLSQFLVKR